MADARTGGALTHALRDLVACLRFFSRLPLPALPFEASPHAPPDIARLALMAPVAGAIIGAIAALALAIATALGLPPFVAAALAIAALVLATGALHEDGLADVADGFGGGATVAQKLDIMRDSRIGAFGAAALFLSLILRIAALTALAGHGLALGVGGLILAAAASRAFALLPLALLPPARADGLGVVAARLRAGGASAAGGAALLIAALLGLIVLGLGHALLGFALAFAAALAMTSLARRQIGGQTGDVAGAAQQLAEIACLIGLLIGRAAA
jgi:adenosylcobinamide-GDP ribazoletransferase